MPSSILSTKLNLPPKRSADVSRARLIDHLNRNMDRKMTLVSAPAGYGKTTLASQWVRSMGSSEDDGPRIAWLSLDDGDNDTNRFLAHLFAAMKETIDTASTGSGDRGRDAITGLINRLASQQENITLVLDDYHVIDTAEVDDMVGFLIEHLPACLHVVIVTRSDPALPLARFRAAGDLNEVRAADLRFSAKEAEELLNDRMDLGLPFDSIATLVQRTEGWIAGINLAALSIKGSSDGGTGLLSISGSHRYVMDYLIEEVLSRQPEDRRRFLLETSILDRMTAHLCDAVTDRSGSQEMLERLARENLFVQPLDDEGYWYRYHQLFAELLRRRLRRGGEDRLVELHRKASAWYEAKGFLHSAADHALASHDVDRVAKFVRQIADTVLFRTGDSESILRWIDALPRKTITANPRVGVAYAWTLFYMLRTADVEPLLAEVEEALRQHPDEDLLAEIDAIRGSMCAADGSLAQALAWYRSAYERATRSNPTPRGIAALGIGYARLVSGDVASAGTFLEEAVQLSAAGGNLGISLKAAVYLGYIRMEQGSFDSAETLFRDPLVTAAKWNLAHISVLSLAYAGLAEIARQHNELDAADEYVAKALSQFSGRAAYQQWFCYIVLAHVRLAQGNIPAALRAVDVAESVMRPAGTAAVATTSRACRTRVFLVAARGERETEKEAEIDAWIGSFDRAIDEASLPKATVLPGYGCDYSHLVAVRALMHRGEIEDACAMLESLESLARSADRVRSLVEILALEALAYDNAGHRESAQSALREAIQRGAQAGFVRVFLDEGPPMARLIYRASKMDDVAEYANRLLRAFPPAEEVQEKQNVALPEPLSDRELDVLRLLAEGLSNSDIGEALFISAQTVKTHTKNIYAKLDAHSRIEAASKARGFGLVP